MLATQLFHRTMAHSHTTFTDLSEDVGSPRQPDAYNGQEFEEPFAEGPEGFAEKVNERLKAHLQESTFLTEDEKRNVRQYLLNPLPDNEDILQYDLEGQIFRLALATRFTDYLGAKLRDVADTLERYRNGEVRLADGAEAAIYLLVTRIVVSKIFDLEKALL